MLRVDVAGPGTRASATADREAEAASRGRLAVTAAWLTDFGTALREFDLALKTYELIGHKRGIAITYTNRTLLLMRLVFLEEALKSIEGSNAYFATVHEQRTIVANGVNASFVNLQLGNARTAKELADRVRIACRQRDRLSGVRKRRRLQTSATRNGRWRNTTPRSVIRRSPGT